MSLMYIDNATMYIDGKKVGEVKHGVINVTPPVKIEHRTRWGHGYDYDEKYYLCPNCGKLLAYHNGVVLVFGNKQAKYCSDCGNRLYWEEKDEI